MSLKAVLLEIPEDHQELNACIKFVLPVLIAELAKKPEVSIDVVEIITCVIEKFGKRICGFNDAVCIERALALIVRAVV